MHYPIKHACTTRNSHRLVAHRRSDMVLMYEGHHSAFAHAMLFGDHHTAWDITRERRTKSVWSIGQTSREAQ